MSLLLSHSPSLSLSLSHTHTHTHSRGRPAARRRDADRRYAPRRARRHRRADRHGGALATGRAGAHRRRGGAHGGVGAAGRGRAAAWNETRSGRSVLSGAQQRRRSIPRPGTPTHTHLLSDVLSGRQAEKAQTVHRRHPRRRFRFSPRWGVTCRRLRILLGLVGITNKPQLNRALHYTHNYPTHSTKFLSRIPSGAFFSGGPSWLGNG